MKYDKKAGVSLIIAMLYTMAFMLVMGSLAEVILRTGQNRRDWKMSVKARDLATSAAELASDWVAAGAIGANVTLTAADADLSGAALERLAEDLGVSGCKDIDPAAPGDQPCVGFEVKGRSTAADTVQIGGSGPLYYSIPVKTTGSGSSTCVDANDANDACNWNRLRFGESVEIPLYYEDESGAPVKLNLTSSDLKLRVRAPACTGSPVDGCVDGRVQLFPMVETSLAPRFYRRIDKDPVLVQWLISDEGGDQTMVAGDYKNPISNLRPDISPIEIENWLRNTEITGGRINEASDIAPRLIDNIILDKTQWGNDVLTRRRIVIQTFTGSLSVSKPILRLSLVGQPRKDDDNLSTPFDSQYEDFLNDRSKDISYLEYQLLTTQDTVSDSKSYVKAWAHLGDFGKTIRKNIERPATLGGFAMESI